MFLLAKIYPMSTPNVCISEDICFCIAYNRRVFKQSKCLILWPQLDKLCT